jgi:UDP-N-acetyl-D-glucosamine dehydrogenase
LANEFAIVCHKLGISVWEVIEGAKTKPFGFMPFYPGPGIGGHCIPCDPLYLSWKAKRLGFKTKMIDLSSYINHFMPHYTVERVKHYLNEDNKLLKNSKILVAGVTYKKDVKDLRESSALDIIEELIKVNARVDYHDHLIPYLKIDRIDKKSIQLTKKNLAKYDCVIIITAHSKINYVSLRKNAKFIFDTRNVYKKDFDNIRRL